MKYFIHLPMKMELIEGSETSAISIVTPGNYPKENILNTTTHTVFRCVLYLPRSKFVTQLRNITIEKHITFSERHQCGTQPF